MSGGGAEREGETQNLKQAPGSELSAHTARLGARTHKMQDHDLSRSWCLTDGATQVPQSKGILRWTKTITEENLL